MSLAFPDVQGTRLQADAAVTVLAPRHHQEVALAAYEDAELLLSSILPDARIEHVGATAVAGAYSRGGVDVCVAVPPDAFDEAMSVLCEAGYLPRAHDPASESADRHAVLAAPHGDGGVTLQLVESGSCHESLMRLRDLLRADPVLLARLNAAKIDAAPLGGEAYADAKARFFADVLS